MESVNIIIAIAVLYLFGHAAYSSSRISELEELMEEMRDEQRGEGDTP